MIQLTELLAVTLAAIANMLIFGSVIYGALSPKLEDRWRLWAVILFPGIFNLAVTMSKASLSPAESVAGALATLAVGGGYAALVISGNFPPKRQR